MSEWENWLTEATRHLSRESTARARAELQEHYQSARDSALSSGASAVDADRLALNALGDAKQANCQYQKVLLTSAEAKLLRESNWEASAVCSRPWLRPLLLTTSLAALSTTLALFLTGAIPATLGIGIAGISLLLATPFLPIYTPMRARIVRGLKWIVLAGTLAVAFGPDTLKWSWLLLSCLWPIAWIEWTRTSIRRKLPVSKWPRQLYL